MGSAFRRVKMNHARLQATIAFLEEELGQDIGSAIDDDIADLIIATKSIDLGRAREILRDQEAWAATIAAHLFVDHILSEMISDFSVREASDAIGRRRSTIDRLEFLYQVGVIQKDTFACLSKLNALRNRFAHTLSFEIDDARKADFATLAKAKIPPASRWAKSLEYLGECAFRAALMVCVLATEECRMAYVISSVRNYRAKLDLERELEEARKSLERHNRQGRPD